jgi:cell division protein FtsI/penicillin-binding protein 2
MMPRTRSRGAHAATHRAPRTAPRPGRPARETPGQGAQGDGAGSGTGNANGQVGGSRVARRLSRATLGKLAAVVVVLGVISFGLVQGGAPSAEPTVQKFLLAWEQRQYKTAAGLTTGSQETVADALHGAYRQLDAGDLVLQMARITQHGSSARVWFSASVDLGSGGLSWQYQGSFGMRVVDGSWKVLWSPSVIVPGLQPGDRLAVLTSVPSRAPLQDSDGRPLVRPSRVIVLGVRPDQLTHPRKTADALAAIAGIGSSSQVYGQIIAAPSTAFLGLIRMSPATYARLRQRLAQVPGPLIVHRRMERLFDSIAPAVTGAVGTETASVLRQNGVPYRPGTTVGLSGLQQAYQRTLTGSPTIEVVLQNASGGQVKVLKRWTGSDGSPVKTTLDSRAQIAADSALARLPRSAAIVAVQAGTGRILAVAAHHAGRMPAVSPLAGRYEPGQVFTIVSTAALLETGFDPRSQVPCKSENTVGNIRFTNHPPEVGLGSQPAFSVDFAHACGTAFAGLFQQLTPSELSSAAKRFGIGATWQLRVDSYSGTIGAPQGYGQIAATAIGADGVRVSPLDMALAVGLVQSGAWHVPELVTGQTAAPGLAAAGRPFSSQVIGDLRKLMRSAVRHGAGRAADVGGSPVFGQVGSSVLSPGGKGMRTSWFVGYQGKIAFAVVELTRSPSMSAAPLAGAFLRDLRTGS